MERASAVAAKTALLLIRLIKNNSKILKLLQIEKFQFINPDFLSLKKKKIRHRIHYIFANEAES